MNNFENKNYMEAVLDLINLFGEECVKVSEKGHSFLIDLSTDSNYFKYVNLLTNKKMDKNRIYYARDEYEEFHYSFMIEYKENDFFLEIQGCSQETLRKFIDTVFNFDRSTYSPNTEAYKNFIIEFENYKNEYLLNKMNSLNSDDCFRRMVEACEKDLFVGFFLASDELLKRNNLNKKFKSIVNSWSWPINKSEHKAILRFLNNK